VVCKEASCHILTDTATHLMPCYCCCSCRYCPFVVIPEGDLLLLLSLFCLSSARALSESSNPASCVPPKSVISTEAVHSFIVNSAVERPPHLSLSLPLPCLCYSLLVIPHPERSRRGRNLLHPLPINLLTPKNLHEKPVKPPTSQNPRQSCTNALRMSFPPSCKLEAEKKLRPNRGFSA
jgi:hypothetical protein